MTNTTWANVLSNAKRPSFLPVMARKAFARIKEFDLRREREVTMAWCAARAEDVAVYARNRDAALWSEAVAVARDREQRARAILNELGVSLGGGAHTALLYFLVRYRRPRAIVETGVAAGFSSQAMLTALERNGTGMLYSSDFPYVRLKEPERFVGAVVDDVLKHRWRLHLAGDRRNLESILPDCGPVDLFHYDSDKSYAGRAYVMARIEQHLVADALVIMDDIQDNSFFRNYVGATGALARVFRLHDKFIGMIDRSEGGPSSCIR